ANWSSRFDPAAAGALAKSDLHHPAGDRRAVTGSFTLNLPVPVLHDCVVFYAGQAMPLTGGTIRTGETVPLVWEKPVQATQWIQKESKLTELLGNSPGAQSSAARAPQAGTANPVAARATFPMLGVLFHEAAM